MRPVSVHPLQRGEQQARRESGSQRTVMTTTMDQTHQQMEPINRELDSFIRNSQATLFFAKNIDSNESSVRTNEPADAR
jgi:hypothetical protein